ncbi:hypothetical protein HPB51_012475 [Rhipicephalus microplus]|uniref:Uncharacterized protein n=1 Tax=Rhipicephalus microplus TaxID=6941 RepID=A0A9J6E9M1_RHIMP|nr:hypothetical protein HPB51_012475 [Rhipicephalus microplus]
MSQAETVISPEVSTTTTAQGEASTSVVADQTPSSSRRSSIQHQELQTASSFSRSDVPEVTQGSSLEEENRMLRKEVSTLNQEMASVLQRIKNADAEKQRLQNRLDHWSSQVSASDSTFRELQARERDLTSALEAKDSQLAVLRVRLQEADQELTTKRRLVDDLRNENQRCVFFDARKHFGLPLPTLIWKTVETLRDKLAHAEEALRKEQESHRHAQAEFMQRQLKMEEELANLSESLTLAQKQLAEQKAHAKESGSQVSSLRCSLDLARQELADYKQKAQRILQSKEKLIASLKDAANASGSSLDGSEVDGSRLSAASAAELEAMTTGVRAPPELESLQEQQRDLLKDLKQERHQRQEVELEARQATEASADRCGQRMGQSVLRG